ncbi:hypothetical protein [Embleya sp. NPDC001921]
MVPTIRSASPGRNRWAGVLTRWILLVVLACGVVGMHTLGHPASAAAESGGASAAGSGGASGAAFAAGSDVVAQAEPVVESGAESVSGTRVASGAAEHAVTNEPATGHGRACPSGDCAPADRSGDKHGSEHGTDPASMCLAVLFAGLGALATALALLALRRARDPRAFRPRARAARFVSGLPPPGPPELSLLQVLRI